jgi:hypothetical protein
MRLKENRVVKFISSIIAILFVWRGVVGLMDMYLFPNDPAISNIFSIVLGIVLFIIVDRFFDGFEL